MDRDRELQKGLSADAGVKEMPRRKSLQDWNEAKSEYHDAIKYREELTGDRRFGLRTKAE